MPDFPGLVQPKTKSLNLGKLSWMPFAPAINLVPGFAQEGPLREFADQVLRFAAEISQKCLIVLQAPGFRVVHSP